MRGMDEPDNQCNEVPMKMQVPGREFTQNEKLEFVFSYHDDSRKVPNYVAVRTAAKHLAEVILNNAPPSADRSTALRSVREAVLWANAAIALDGRNL